MPLEVMLNGGYGWFSFSEEAKRAYREAGGHFDKASEIDRHDALMVGIVKRMGSAAHWKGSGIRIMSVPDRFAEYYLICEENGAESVVIQHDLYKLDTLKAILNDEQLTASECIARANEVLDEKFAGLSDAV